MFHVEHKYKMEEIKQCLICGNDKFTEFLVCKDHFLTNETFKIVKCSSCGFAFINPRPEKDQLQKYYESIEYISHSGTSKGIINTVYKKVRRYTHKKKFKLVSNYAKGNSILDIGCGSGELLSLFKENNWKTFGIEPNDNARNFAISEYGLNVNNEESISGISNKSIDVVTMWHVLEHVSELNERISEIKRTLKENGVLFVAVPNNISYDAEYYKEFWAAYDVPRHLYHFTPDTIKKLLEKYKFSIIEMLPMKFDSYYVSMLSEKYKTGKNNIIRAFFIGFKSNLKAREKSAYSSQIYIVRNT
jgi:2-polyprenyl-3-methyl-5-hydroxy-6-metoxy-1,4-benzoquinol methylase